MAFLSDVWEKLKTDISSSLNKPSMNLWINPLSLIEINGDKAVFLIANSPHAAFHKDVLQRQYTNVIKDALRKEFNFDISVEFVIEEDLPTYAKKNNIKKEETEDIIEKTEDIIETFIPKVDYTFETFVVGASNSFVYSAALAVANTPGGAYNPLFIYGKTGLGKTHLLYSIQNEVKKKNNKLNIIYISTEEFANEIITAIRDKKTFEFRNKYRTADFFLIDDVQFLSGKESTQAELFHTFNVLYDNNVQIVLSSDRPPKDIPLLEERLRSRFEMGLMADIQSPDFELRSAIIRRKSEYYNIRLSEDVIDVIASKLKINIRQIEGVIKKIKAICLLTGITPTVATAQTAIRDVINENEPAEVKADRIISEVCRFYNVTPDAIKSKNKTADISLATHVCVYIINEATDLSLIKIGRLLDRDHTTIHHSIEKIKKDMIINPTFKNNIELIIKNINEK